MTDDFSHHESILFFFREKFSKSVTLTKFPHILFGWKTKSGNYLRNVRPVTSSAVHNDLWLVIVLFLIDSPTNHE